MSAGELKFLVDVGVGKKVEEYLLEKKYELFHIAAEEKGWPGYQVERHFKRYLEDQTLADYVKEFLEDGKEYINAYRPKR